MSLSLVPTLDRLLPVLTRHVIDSCDAFEAPVPANWRQACNDLERPNEGLAECLKAACWAHRAAELGADGQRSLDEALSQARCDLTESPGGIFLPERRGSIRRQTLRLMGAALVVEDAIPDGLPAGVRDRVQALHGQWQTLRAEVTGFADRLDALRNRDGFLLSLCAETVREQCQAIDRFAFHAIRTLVVSHFSVGSKPLELDTGDLEHLLLGQHEQEAPITFAPRRLFRMLWDQIAPRANDLMSQQVADAFVTELGLAHQPEITQQRGFVVLPLRAWVDSFDKKYGRTRYSTHSRDHIERALKAVADIWTVLHGDARQAEAADALKAAIALCRDADWRPGPGLKPRLLGVELRTYQGRVDVLIPEAFAGAINAFVTQHSTKLREALTHAD